MTEFDDFVYQCLSHSNIQGNQNDLCTITTVKLPRDPVQEFKHVNNHDTTTFINLKEDKKWDNWNCTPISQAREEDVLKVLDSQYIPIMALDYLMRSRSKCLHYLSRYYRTTKEKHWSTTT